MRLSVIIVNYHSEESLRTCLLGLCNPDVPPGMEILVVDNGSTESLAAALKDDFPAVRWLTPGTNLGFGRACNRAASETAGSHLLFLNPDTRISRSAIFSVLSSLDAVPLCDSIVGLRILNPDGSHEFSARAFPDWRSAIANRYSLLTRIWPGNPWSRRYLRSSHDENTATRVDWVSGAALIIPSSLFNSLGGFDERFFLFMEDVDLCLRAQQAGVPVWYWPGASISHEIGVSSSRFQARALQHRHVSIWRYYRKHLRVPLADPAVAAFLTLRFVSLYLTLRLSRITATFRGPQQEPARTD